MSGCGVSQIMENNRCSAGCKKNYMPNDIKSLNYVFDDEQNGVFILSFFECDKIAILLDYECHYAYANNEKIMYISSNTGCHKCSNIYANVSYITTMIK